MSAAVERFAKEFLAVYGASGYRTVAGAPPGTGARPWSRRLCLTSLKAIRQNQALGVRYAPLYSALLGLPGAPSDRVLPTPEAVMSEIVDRGAVLARLPPPSSIAAVCMGFDPAGVAWLVPVAPLAASSRLHA